MPLAEARASWTKRSCDLHADSRGCVERVLVPFDSRLAAIYRRPSTGLYSSRFRLALEAVPYFSYTS